MAEAVTFRCGTAEGHTCYCACYINCVLITHLYYQLKGLHLVTFTNCVYSFLSL